MATTGTITGVIMGAANKNWQLKDEFSYTQNITNNTTTIVHTLSVYNNNSAHNTSANSAYYEIQGTRTYATYNYNSTKAWHQLGTKTETITHQADGTATIAIQAKWYSGISGSSYTPETLTIATTLQLNTIPRASSLDNTNFWSNSNYMGSSMTLTVIPTSNTFKHILKYKMSGQNSETQIATLAAGTTTYSWTIPTTSFYALCPNSKSLSGNLYIYTMNGNTQIGSKSYIFMATVPENSNTKPQIGITLVEKDATIAALTGSTGGLLRNIIKGYSDIECTLSTSARASARITSTTVSYNNTTQNYTEPITYTDCGASNRWDCSITDSRGFSATTYTTATVLNYFKPTINLKVGMVLVSGDDSKCNATLNITGTMFNQSFGSSSNSATVKYRYKQSGGSYNSWSSAGSAVFSGNNYAVSKAINNLNSSKTYVFQVMITDALATTTSGEITATVKPIFDMSGTNFRFNVPLLSPLTIYNTGTNTSMLYIENDNYKISPHIASSGNRGIWDFNYQSSGSTGSWIIARRASDNRVIVQDDLSTGYIYTNGINPLDNNDTVNYNSAFIDYPAHTSNAGKDLIFCIKTNRSMANVSSLSLTSCKLAVRTSNGYIKVGNTQTDSNGYDFYNDSNATIQVVRYDTYNFYVRITMNTAFTNIPNNNCCVAVACLGMTVKFNT